MAELQARERQAKRTDAEAAASAQEIFELYERVLGRLGLLPGNPALDSQRELVVRTEGGMPAGKGKTNEREG